jgi:carbamoyltransferase
MNILGISCFYHDAAAALLVDGRLVAAAEEERFSRKKHDSDFPLRAIDFCLSMGGIRAGDLDYVVFYEKPFTKFERILQTVLGGFPRTTRLFQDSMLHWLTDKLWIKSLIRQHLGVGTDRILFSEHHLSHAASAFFCSPFEDAAVLTVDGVGEWATATMGVGRGTTLTLDREMRFPHSLGLLYSVFTAFLGFEVNEGEYKVMGMAPYGRPRYVDKVHRVLRLAGDGSLWLDMDYFSFHRSPTKAFTRKFEALFGPPRPPQSHFFTPTSGYPSYFGSRPADFEAQAQRNQYYADVAASIQAVTEEVLLAMARAAYAETGLPRLAMAGGVALNSVANGRILRETPFEEIYVQPAAGDGGGAVGAALYAYHCLLGNPRSFVMEHAYWGRAYDEDDTRAAIAATGLPAERIGDEERIVERAVDALASGKVIGWFNGRFEWGPRALGNRSILADPGRADMKDIVNTKIKFREPYRPFAPSVLVEHAERFFDLPDAKRHYPARFMLYVTPVKDGARDKLPAITHVDGSARLQTVDRDLNPRYYKLIEAFGQQTGTPVVLNTSFNLKGEPIVSSPADALSTFARSGMDLLVLNDWIVGKP